MSSIMSAIGRAKFDGAVRLTFPWAALASSNQRNRRRGGKAHSTAYKTSREAVAMLAMGQVKDRPAFPDGPLAVRFRFYPPDYQRRDELNLCKGLADGLNGIAWGDDSQLRDVSVLRGRDSQERRGEEKPGRSGRAAAGRLSGDCGNADKAGDLVTVSQWLSGEAA